MEIYDSSSVYIEKATSLQDKITRIDAVISALLTTATKAAANDHLTEYMLDDGQTKIQTTYRGTDEIFKSIQAFEKLKNIYVNQLNGRVFRLTDSKNFTGNNFIR